MKKLIFIYDSLMKPNIQKLTHIPLNFLSYGYIRAKMYWFNDDKQRRYFVVPPVKKEHSRQYNTYVFGGLYLMDDFEEHKGALYSFYNCSFGFTNFLNPTDMYIPSVMGVVPVSFTSLEEFDNCKYERSDMINSLVMVGNQSNQIIQKSINKGRYYRHMRGIDAVSFLASLEKNNGKPS